MKFVVNKKVDLINLTVRNSYTYNMVCNIALGLGVIPWKIELVNVLEDSIKFDTYNLPCTPQEFYVLLKNAFGSKFNILFRTYEDNINWYIEYHYTNVKKESKVSIWNHKL